MNDGKNVAKSFVEAGDGQASCSSGGDGGGGGSNPPEPNRQKVSSDLKERGLKPLAKGKASN